MTSRHDERDGRSSWDRILCELEPLWPCIAVALSGLAVLATMLLVQRLLTLEIREEVHRDIDGIDSLPDPTVPPSEQKLFGSFKSVRGLYFRLFLLLLPGLLLLFGSSFLLYKVIFNDCDWLQRTALAAIHAPA